MNSKWIILSVGLTLLLGIVACATSTPAPTVAPTAAPTGVPATTAPAATSAPAATKPPTAAPTATAMPTSDNCIACHTNKATLEKLATKQTVKSEETKGEG